MADTLPAGAPAAPLADLLQAAAPLLRPAFTLLGSPVTALELAAFVLGVAMVLCNLRVNPLGWPLAIASSLLYGLLFADSRLYGEAGLQLVFVAVSLWGWWQWRRGRDAAGSPLRVRRLSARGRWAVAGCTLAAWPLLAVVLHRVAGGSLPWLDALPTVGSLAGQWLLARKYLENWAVWVAVNAASIVLFAAQGLWLTVLLYAVFLALSFAGWQAWRRRADAASAPVGARAQART